MTLFRIFTLVALQRGQKLNNRQSAKKVLSFLAIRFGILCAITAGYFVIFMVLKSFFATFYAYLFAAVYASNKYYFLHCYL